MAIALSGLKKVTARSAPRCIIYGPPGCGKTSFAAEAPNPVFLMTEEGVPGDLELNALGPNETDNVFRDFESLMMALVTLRDEEHEFETIVIDTVDGMEPLIWRYVCEENKWKTIESPGYGRGYVEAVYKWREFIELCDEIRNRRSINIVWLAHSKTQNFEDPMHGPYSRFIMNIHAKAADALEYDSDIVGFLNIGTEVQESDKGFNQKSRTAQSEGVRFIFLDRRPAFNAKNRYEMPARIRYQRGQGWSKLAAHLPGGSAKEKKKEAA